AISTLKMQVQQLKDELAKAKEEELAQEKSSVESRIANVQITSAYASAREYRRAPVRL
ncbi:MAG: hypothetical protein SGPRY_007351, partial [Prymnesium sp.]